MLASSTGVTYAKHFCGDFEVISTITLGEKNLSCGMEMYAKKCDNEMQEENHHCCKNKYENIDTDDITLSSTSENNNIKFNEFDTSDTMQEVIFNLEDLSHEETVNLKQPSEVYYQMYRDAIQKAKVAREMALSSYLEAKNIKNTYMLTDIDDSDMSDMDMDDDSIVSDKSI